MAWQQKTGGITVQENGARTIEYRGTGLGPENLKQRK